MSANLSCLVLIQISHFICKVLIRKKMLLLKCLNTLTVDIWFVISCKVLSSQIQMLTAACIADCNVYCMSGHLTIFIICWNLGNKSIFLCLGHIQLFMHWQIYHLLCCLLTLQTVDHRRPSITLHHGGLLVSTPIDWIFGINTVKKR